jgi:hypothetical protein
VDAGPPFLVAGNLRDEADASVPGSIAVDVQPLDGPGWVGRYSASGIVPGAAVDAYLSAYVNRDGVGPGPVHATLYAADFRQPGDSASRIPNGDFSAGPTSWFFLGAAAFAVEDGGTVISFAADAGEAAWSGSTLFAVTADAGFSASYLARIAPVSTGNGFWMVAFFGSDGGYVGGVQMPFAAARADAGSAATDGGAFAVDLTAFGTSSLQIEASYDGSDNHWPAYGRATRR